MKSQVFKYSLSLLMSAQLYAVDTYTVDELIIQALENSPDLKISLSNYKAAASREDQAGSAYLPTVDLKLSAGKFGRTDVPDTDMVDDDLLLGNLSLKQLIYDFGKTGSNIDSFVNETNALNELNTQKISDKKRDVKLAYYVVVQAVSLIEVNKENVKLNEAQLYRSQKYFEAGIRTKIDVSDAKVELIKAKLDLKQAQYDLKLAYASLDKVIGLKEIENNYDVYAQKLNLDNIFSSLSDYSLNLSDSIHYAYENKNELKQYMFNVKSAEAKSNLASSDYYPDLYFGADYTKQKVDKFEDTTPEDEWKAGINLDWNIYQGGYTDALSQEKRLDVDKSHSEYNNAKLGIKNQVTEAYIGVNRAKDTVELSQSLLEVSDEKFDQAGKRYENGLSDFIELQQARQGYIDAKSSLVVNYYSYYQAIAYLDNAIGK